MDEDHPRPCGEQRPSFLFPSYIGGSPPPMRGTGAERNLTLTAWRITPAHAGNSPGFQISNVHIKDHPRPCGEQVVNNHTKTRRPGSPPPMRGTALASDTIPSISRITPAHAGNSRKTCLCKLSWKDHPRPCGEQADCTGRNRTGRGSPPPMRGTVSAPL